MAAAELDKVDKELAAEAQDDAQLRETYEGRWNRPTSSALNAAMREKVAGYRYPWP